MATKGQGKMARREAESKKKRKKGHSITNKNKVFLHFKGK